MEIHDFPHVGLGATIPYGTYDVQRNQSLLKVGMTHKTAEFAVESIRWWWQQFGRH